MKISRKQFHIMQNERHMNRRLYIIKVIWGNKDMKGWKPDHFYMKNKAHCSCPLCSVKTNARHPSIHYKGLNHGGKNWKHSDLRNLML